MTWILFLVVGLGTGSVIVIPIITDRPPPDSRTRLMTVMVVAGLGGLLAHALFGQFVTAVSDPMPIMPLGVLAGTVGLALFFGAMTAITLGFADRPAP